MITLIYRTCDGVREERVFHTLRAAQRYAEEWMGSNAEIGSSYAVSSDGIATMSVQGASLREVFGRSE